MGQVFSLLLTSRCCNIVTPSLPRSTQSDGRQHRYNMNSSTPLAEEVLAEQAERQASRSGWSISWEQSGRYSEVSLRVGLRRWWVAGRSEQFSFALQQGGPCGMAPELEVLHTNIAPLLVAQCRCVWSTSSSYCTSCSSFKRADKSKKKDSHQQRVCQFVCVTDC